MRRERGTYHICYYADGERYDLYHWWITHALLHNCKLSLSLTLTHEGERDSPQLVKLSNIAPQVVTLHCLLSNTVWPHQRRLAFHIARMGYLRLNNALTPHIQEMCSLDCLNDDMLRHLSSLPLCHSTQSFLLS